jgi:hypothetical protein
MRTLVTILAVLGAVALTSAANAAPLFDDDFQAGIDLSRWVLHPAGGVCWEAREECGNGFIHSPAQLYLGDPRYNIIVSESSAFGDFVMTFDMRFHAQGVNKGVSWVAFRCDDDVSVALHGYALGARIAIPGLPPYDVNQLMLSVRRPDDTIDYLAWVEYPWALDTWYRFKVLAEGNAFKAKVWPLGGPEPPAWMIDTVDPLTSYATGRIGFGDYWQSVTDVDRVVVSSVDATAPSLALRNPQVPLNGTGLQAYLSGIGESVNVYADQLAAQVCSTSVSGNAAFTLMIELADYARFNTIGVYDAFQSTPPLYEVFPGHAGPGWVGLVSFLASGTLVVNLFDHSGILQLHTEYPGVNTSKVGFYLQGPGGCFFSEDARNGGFPQAVLYAGTGRNSGEVWLCWEDLAYVGCVDRDFNDAVLLLQSLQPVPTTSSTWGGLKARYR